MSCNSFSAVVRVITDIEVKNVGQQTLTKCRSVHNSSYKDNSSFYINLNFWGAKASAAEKIVANGDTIFVRGNLACSSVGERTFFDLNVDDFFKVSNKKDAAPKKEPSTKKEEKVEPVEINADEDLPF